MKKKSFRYCATFLCAIIAFADLYAQPTSSKNETQQEYINRMKNMVDSIKKSKAGRKK